MFKSRLSKKEYLFRRTYFMISDEEFVELVALLTEPYQYTYTELHESRFTAATFSREMHISSLPRRKAKILLNKKYLLEQCPINHYQFNYLISHYRDNLFEVTEQLIDRFSKDR